ncbi:MAG TPA: MBL fold metallo-hydrolase [Candidatus Staskawiczbacteria bacterium]|nr:MBL fold metallo-hydrolase [Candidatus Staskawiczbacteria bacterium]
MAEVKILVKGYTSADSGPGEEKTCSTISLVKSGNIIMVCDPGVLADQKILVDALKKEGLNISDINYVFITHSHIDHYRNIGMFANAKTLEYFGIWNGNICENWHENFTDDIKIIKTPGHNYDALTLLVNTKDGVVAICGDVFWKENEPEKDPYASDLNRLSESRKKILQMADWIVPGHADIYKVKK